MVKNPPAVLETQAPSWVGKTPWRRAWQPTPVFWPGEPHGQRSLAGCSPWGAKSQTGLSTGRSMRDSSLSEPAKMTLNIPGLYIQRLTATFSAVPEKLYFGYHSDCLGIWSRLQRPSSFLLEAALPAGRVVVLSGNHDSPPEPSPLKNMWEMVSGLPGDFKDSCMVMDREAWRAVVHGVAKSRTRLSD